MKKFAIIILLLAAAVVALAIRLAYATNDADTNAGDDLTSESSNAAIECIMTRTSVREYSDRPVSKEAVGTILRAGMAAPTAANKQPWQFVVVNNPKIREALADALQYGDNIRNCQVAIVLCGDMKLAMDGDGRDFWVQDLSAASENVLLAAHALGLGAVWCGVYPMQDRVKAVSEQLNLPADVIPLDIIAIGYPKAPTSPKDKWDSKKVHYNKY